MKKIFISAYLLIGISCFSQTTTKKYNSYYKQYEYFDSKGNMVGYEKYNNYLKQWEYYKTSNTSQSQQPTQYRNPQQLSISNLGNAMVSKQNNYNYNVQYLQNVVNTISEEIKNLDLSYEQRQLISDTFQKKCIDEINSLKINYSSANETNRVIKWLYDSLNKIIENTTTTSRTSSNSIIEANYNRILPVYNIVIFDKNEQKIKDDYITSDSYVKITKDEIVFKKANGEVSYRDLKNKIYNEKKKGYEYTSHWGGIFIHEELKYIEFFQNNLAAGENYTYYINSSEISQLE